MGSSENAHGHGGHHRGTAPHPYTAATALGSSTIFGSLKVIARSCGKKRRAW